MTAMVGRWPISLQMKAIPYIEIIDEHMKFVRSQFIVVNVDQIKGKVQSYIR